MWAHAHTKSLSLCSSLRYSYRGYHILLDVKDLLIPTESVPGRHAQNCTLRCRGTRLPVCHELQYLYEKFAQTFPSHFAFQLHFIASKKSGEIMNAVP